MPSATYHRSTLFKVLTDTGGQAYAFQRLTCWRDVNQHRCSGGQVNCASSTSHRTPPGKSLPNSDPKRARPWERLARRGSTQLTGLPLPRDGMLHSLEELPVRKPVAS